MALPNRKTKPEWALIARCIVVSWFLFFCLSIDGAPAQVFRADHYTEAEGLPSSEVRSVVQADDGRMWFSTRNGIAQYDGMNWRIFGAKDGLADANQQLLAIDESRRLWAVSGGPVVTISIFENGTWRQFPFGIPTADPLSILPLKNADTENSDTALIGHMEGLFFVDGEHRVKVDFDLEQHPAVTSLKYFQDRIYASTTNGLYLIEMADQPTAQRVDGSPGNFVRSICVDPRDDVLASEKMWVVGDDWLATFDGNQFDQLDVEFDDPGTKTHGLATSVMSPTGVFYFGSESGLFHYHPQDGVHRLGLENGLIAEGANSVCIDREGLLWVGGERGVSKIASFAFSVMDRRHGLLADEVAAILHRKDGTTVLAHPGGLTMIDGTKLEHKLLGNPRPTKILDLDEDASGNLWIAASEAGVIQIAPSGELTEYPVDGRMEFVHSVRVDNDDQLWFATPEGIYRIEGGQPVLHQWNEEMAAHNSARRLFVSVEGRILAATTRRGIWRDDVQGWRNFPSSQTGNALASVYAYLERDGQPPLVGTSGGVCELIDGQIVKASNFPRIDRPVYFIEEDHQHRLWFGTDDGVYRWDGHALDQFTLEQGLSGRETNRAAGKVDHQGNVWIGTAQGLTIYQPHRDPGRFDPPKLEITRTIAADESLPKRDEHIIAHHRNAVTFHYRINSFVNEKQTQIRSWLQGLETNWQAPEKPHDWKIEYNFLPPGIYQLHLQAANANGNWSEIATSETIHIRPPFWHTAWFHSLIWILVATVGFFSHRFVNQRRYLRRLKREAITRHAELKQSESRFGVTLNSIADGVITTGLEGELRYMNPAAEKIIGKSLADGDVDTLGKFLLALGCSPEDQHDLHEQVLEGTSWTTTLRFKKNGGEDRLVEIGTAPLRSDDQELLGAVVVFRDVTSKVRLQNELDQSKRLASLGNLAGGIAHDFNNLLAVIRWNLSTLNTQSDTEDRENSLELIEDALIQAMRLSEQILTFAQGGTPLLQSCALSGLIRNSTSLVPTDSKIEYVFNIEEDLWPVDVDTVQISQVLQNILSNATQAMPQGGLIKVRARNRFEMESTPPEPVVEIEIEDQGVGIGVDEIGRVFEPYFSTKKKGHGIGLATCYSIVQKHKGKLTVDSELGQGSTFRIQLPASTHTPRPTNEVAQPKVQIQSAKRLLIIDDDELIRKSLTAILSLAGFHVITAGGGSEAIELYRNEMAAGQQIHAVLIDLTMPGGLDGCQTLTGLLDVDPTVRGIVISGYSDEQVLSNYRSHGFVGRLQKPCSLDEIKTVLGQLPDLPEATSSLTVQDTRFDPYGSMEKK